MKNRIRTIFQGVGGAALIVVVAQVLSKGTGFFREVLFAGEYGVGRDFEFYLIAFTIPGILNSVLFYQAQNYFVPIYNEKKQKSIEEAHTFFTSSLVFFTILISTVAFVLYLLSPWVAEFFVPGASGVETEKVTGLFNLALLTLPLNGLISVYSAWLVAEFKFKVTYLSQIWTNIVIICFVFFFGHTLGTMAIVAGYIVGNLFQLIHLVSGGRKVFPVGMKFRISIKSGVSWLIFLNTLFVEVSGQFFIFIDRSFYANTEAGGIAALNYSYIIYMLPVTVFTTALGSALLPDFSANIAKGDLEEANSKFSRAIEIIFLLFIPATLIYAFAGNELISLLYERGRFNSASTVMTGQTLLFYSLSLPLYAVFAVGLKYAYSLKGSGALVAISAAGLLMKYFFSSLLSPAMHQNGLALATTLTYCVQSLMCIWFIVKNSGFRVEPRLLGNGLQFILWPGVILAVSLLLVSQFNLTSLILPAGFIFVYPLILHLTKNSVYGEITSRFIGPK